MFLKRVKYKIHAAPPVSEAIYNIISGGKSKRNTVTDVL